MGCPVVLDDINGCCAGVRNNAAKPNGTVKYALIGIFSGFFLSIYGKVNCKGSKVLPSFTFHFFYEINKFK
jgi:hypothetical protein